MSEAPSQLGSTYRLQLNGVGFAAATRMVPFLSRLGIQTCYASPVTRARSGSSHGYDVIDPTRLDPDLGTPEEFEAFLAALASHQIGLLIDIVPNHMAASLENPFFADVLRLGRDSQFAPWFDIAWSEQDGKVLLPVLGRPLAAVLAAGEIRFVPGDPPLISYFDHRYPVAPGSVDGAISTSLESLLSRQHYRLADWRVANQEVNYRRFFDINELIGVRQEDPAVFAATHSLIGGLAADPRVVGVRVDHVDGLRDPAGYLTMLREVCHRSGPEPVIVVEKILAHTEALPDWPVAGTTGYEFGTTVVGLFVDPAGAADLARATSRATGDARSFTERAVEAKRQAIDRLFPHQLDQVTGQVVAALADSTTDAADFAAAIRELTACLEVYRTYRRPGEPITAEELRWLHAAAEAARPQLAAGAAAALSELVELVSGDLAPDQPGWPAVAAWQQFSGPVAAKGVEDTAMYASGQLLAAADVGSDPDRPAVSAQEFHRAMADRQHHAPGGLSSTSTHDSKRSHDVRCRLAVLSEIAAEWERTVEALDELLPPVRADLRPDAADRRYLYETLIGAWPVAGRADERFAARLREHVVKAAREAKRHTDWLDPESNYEASLQELSDRIILGESASASPVVAAIVASIEAAGATNSIASVLLKVTAPGVPDTYQGDDAWFLALVDPDNRVPLDIAEHAELLSRPTVPSVEGWRTGAVKQHVLKRALEARRGTGAAFAGGRYQPIEVTGEHREHVIGFARIDGEQWWITVVPRLVHRLAGPGRFPLGSCWTDTSLVLPPGCPREFVDVLSDGSATADTGRLPVAGILADLPVALLRSVP